MKKILLVLLIIFSTQIFAQKNSREKIKAMKTAFITNALDLSSKEAEKFWPIYNTYDKKIYQVKVLKTRELTRMTRNAGGIEQLSDAEAKKLLKEFIDIDFEVAKAKQELRENLLNVISVKKIIRLFRAEQNFNKRLLREFRDSRKKNIKNK